MFVPSLIMIASSNFKLDGIWDRYSANYGIFWHLINLTKFNRQVNNADISARDTPDLKNSLVYVEYIRATYMWQIFRELQYILSFDKFDQV